MQATNSRTRASLRFPRIARFDSDTGKPRRRWVALAGAVALALVLGSGIAVAATGAADAHNPKVSANCAGVTVFAEWYNTDNTDGDPTPNSIEATIDGVVQDTIRFGASGTGANAFTHSYAFADQAKAQTYTITVRAWDDPLGSKGWTQTITRDWTPCAPPTVSAQASACNVAGSSTAVTASFGGLVAGREYTVDLARNGAAIQSFPIVSTQTTWPDTATGLPSSWATLPAGATYAITITDTTVPGLSARTEVVSVGCPNDPKVRVEVLQCVSPEDRGTFTIIADVVPQRVYEVTVYRDNAQIDTFTEPAANALLTRQYPGSPSSTFYFTLRDVAADPTGSSIATSIAEKFLPCPEKPAKPVLTINQCTATSDVSDATLAIAVTGLVPDRSYSITVTGGPTSIPAVSLTPALSSNWSSASLGLDPGTYVVTVTDVSDARATGYVESQTAMLTPCPSQQEVTLEASVCTVPGGTSDITATVTKLAVGRSYSIALSQNNAPVDAYPAEVVTPTTTDPYLVTYSGLAAGLPYRVIVTDTVLTSIIGVADVTPAACPGNPEVVTSAKCTLLGGSSVVNVTIDKLVAGEAYTASITRTSTGAAVPGVADQTFSGDSGRQSIQFTQVPVGANYTVLVTNATRTLSSSSSILLTTCDVELKTLALTGASTMTPTLAGIGFLQFGLVLVGISIFRRRSGALEN